MSTTKRILTIWVVYLFLSLLSLAVLPHHYVDKMGWVQIGLHVLLLILCLYLSKNSSRASRPIFINFVLFFFLAFMGFNYVFVGETFLKDFPYAVIFYHTYVVKFGIYLMLAVSLLYLSVDYFFSKLKVFQKYLLTLSIVIPIFFVLFKPYIIDPLSLYNAEEYRKYLNVKSAYAVLSNASTSEPTSSEIQQMIVGQSSMPVTIADVENYKKYLAYGAETILFWKPLNLNIIYVNLFLVCSLGFFVFHKYRNDKPHPAYLEKIAILFILWCSFDAFHYFAFINVQSLELYRTMFTISQYLGIFTVLLMVYVFSMRLRFVLSPSGQYYEEELLLRPESITRWRDEIDTLILNSFFTTKKLFGRLVTFTPNTDGTVTTSNKNR
jgi:hypothetical protein